MGKPARAGVAMRFDVLPASGLDAALCDKWQALQGRADALASPFFSVGFAQSVEQARGDLHVGLIEDDTALVGLLPFHRKRGGQGVPLAGQYCDYQGVIGQAPLARDVPAMLRGFGLSSYDFNHALECQPIFDSNAFWHSGSPRADLRAGYDAWKSEVSAKTNALKTLARKERKISREIGPLRFNPQDDDASSWQSFVAWKDQALRRLGQPGFPGPAWVAGLIDALRDPSVSARAGCFSTLYAGDRLVAAHFGLRSARVWHWWFPSYDADLSAYSPGLLLLRHCIEAAAQDGCHELDFGRGTERYKTEFSNRSRALCEGSLERASLTGAIWGTRKTLQRAANRILPARGADILRRGATKVLRAGLL